MELKSYLKIIKAERRLIAAITMLVAVSAYAFSVYMPAHYDASASLFLSKAGTQTTEEFKYDGYYALESSKIVSDNVEKMLQSPQLVEKIYNTSGIDPEFKNLKSYKKKFTAKKMSNSYVEVSFETDSREDAGRLSEAITSVINEELKRTSDQSQAEVAFNIEKSTPVILESRPDAKQNLFIGIVSGVFLGLFAAFLRRYLA